MKKNILTFLAIFISSISFSQDIIEDSPYKMNQKYEKIHHKERKNVVLNPVREADVMWSRKIWRDIDLRQKMNHPLYYPQENEIVKTVERDNLFTTLYNAATTEQSIRIFNANFDDEFQNEIDKEELERIVQGSIVKIEMLDRDGETMYDENGEIMYEEGTERKDGISQRNIKTWRVKEEWFFDKQRSVMDVRIIGLCPIADQIDANGELTGIKQKICWFYFPEVRTVLKNSLAYNLVKNEAENKTYEDIFMKRMFASTIVREGNVYDRRIDQYKIGLDALLEAERIKEEIFNIEHDLWEY